MCGKCEELARMGDVYRLLQRCIDGTGLEPNATCRFCDMPVKRLVLQSGKIRERNRDGKLHESTCPAVFSRMDDGKIAAPARRVRYDGENE